MELFIVYSEAIPYFAIDTFYYRYQFITSFLHLYTVDIFPWNFGVIQVREFLTNYLDF